jgi:imidazolonepropionase-like amidohydrolase
MKVLRIAAIVLCLDLVMLSGHAQTLAITHARLIDGTGGPVKEDVSIVLDGPRIVAVGGADLTIPPGSRIIDARGKTVMPGLADMHVHLVGGWDGVHTDILGYQNYLNALLYAGVTTVLDTGNVPIFVLQMRAAIAKGQVLGPRIYCVGPLLDGPDAMWGALSIPISSIHQVPSIVKQLSDEKVDLIKLYVGLSDSFIREVSEEAKKQNLRTIIDQGDRNGSIDLMNEGIAGFAHLPFHRISDDAVQIAKNNHIFFISTLAVQEALTGRRLKKTDFLNEPLLHDTMPPSQFDALKAMTQRPLSPEQEKELESATQEFKRAESNVNRLWDAGVLIAAGTDGAYPGDSQGEGLHRELELLVEAGLTPLQAIQSATQNASIIVEGNKEWGTIEKGKLANLLLIDGKPDQNIHDTRRITEVIYRGKILDREKLKFTPASTDFVVVGTALSQ